MVKASEIRIAEGFWRAIDHKMNREIDFRERIWWWEIEKLRYFVGQMDIRNQNPSLFRAFGFRPLVEKCSVRATKSYIVARIDPLSQLDRTLCLSLSFHHPLPFSTRIFRMRSVRRVEIVDFQSRRESYGIIDRSRRRMRERSYGRIWVSFSARFRLFPNVSRYAGTLCDKKKCGLSRFHLSSSAELCPLRLFNLDTMQFTRQRSIAACGTCVSVSVKDLCIFNSTRAWALVQPYHHTPNQSPTNTSYSRLRYCTNRDKFAVKLPGWRGGSRASYVRIIYSYRDRSFIIRGCGRTP